MLALWNPNSFSVSFISPERNALSLSDRISAGTPCQLTTSSTSNLAMVTAVWSDTANTSDRISAGTPCRLTTSSTSNLAMVAAVWSDTANTSGSQIVHEDDGVPVSQVGARELDHVHSYPVEWTGNRDRSQWWTSCTPSTASGACQTASGPMSDVSSHASPPVVAPQLTVNLYITQVRTKHSLMCLPKQSLPLSFWRDDSEGAVWFHPVQYLVLDCVLGLGQGQGLGQLLVFWELHNR